MSRHISNKFTALRCFATTFLITAGVIAMVLASLYFLPLITLVSPIVLLLNLAAIYYGYELTQYYWAQGQDYWYKNTDPMFEPYLQSQQSYSYNRINAATGSSFNSNLDDQPRTKVDHVASSSLMQTASRGLQSIVNWACGDASHSESSNEEPYGLHPY